MANEYRFKVLAAELKISSNFARSVTSVIQLDQGQSLPERIYLVSIGNDYSSNPNAIFGPEEWVTHALLQSLVHTRIPLSITLRNPIQNIELPEQNPQGEYYYNPGRISMSQIIMMVIENPKDPSNLFRFSWTKTPSEGDSEKDGELDKFTEPTLERQNKATPLFRTTFSREDLTFESSGYLYGNFSASYTAACAGGPNYYQIELGAITSRTKLPSPCSNGHNILMIEYV